MWKGLLLWFMCFHHATDCVPRTAMTGQFNGTLQDVEMDKTSADILFRDPLKSFSSFPSFIFLFEVHNILQKERHNRGKKIMLPWSLHCKPWTHKWPIPSGWRRTGNELGRTIMIITKIEVILQNLCCQPLWKQEQIWRKTQIQRRWHYGQPTMFLMIRTSWKVTLVSPKNLLPLYHSSVVNGEKNDVEVRNNSTPQAVLTW